VAAALCAVGAIVLLLSTFLDWYPEGVEGAYFNRSVGAPADDAVFVPVGGINAWQAFAVVDLALAVVSAVAAWAALAAFRRRSDRVANLAATLGGAIALGLTIWRSIDEPLVLSGVGLGPVVAAAAATAIACGGLIATLARER
jgi:hypothetical protein